MFSLRNPTPELAARLIAQCGDQAHSYSEVGATRAVPPAGYNIDHHRVVLGRGAEAFRRAVKAIDEWRMFDMPWVRLFPPTPAVKERETVAVVVSHLGFFSINASRVVYVIQEERRYGFAYGTLPCHAEQGEERFMLEHDARTDEVWYDLYAFSRPRHFLARLGYPVSRHLQKRFAKDSLAAMKRAVASSAIADV